MRRLVGISARSAVAMALPLMGAIYVAAEATQAAFRRHNEGLVRPQTSTISQVSAQNLVAKRGEAANNQPSADLAWQSVATSRTPNSGSAQSDPRQDELAAEQQASELPAQKPARQAAKDPHTRQIVISIPDRQLALLQDAELVVVYPVAVGASETPSPEGDFTVMNHAVDPTYRHEGKEIGPGKNNPLGTRWMGLSLKGYGIHGTNVQSSVGKAVSHGCFRMKKKDVEELYTRVKVGDAVTIRGERDELTASLFSETKPAKTETQIASAATASATAAEDQ